MTVDEENGGSDDLERRVVETLIDLREERGWSQSELARRMVEAGWSKYTQMTVSRTEKGERPIRLNEARALADVFGVELFNLWLPRNDRRYSLLFAELRTARDRLLESAIQYLDVQDNFAAAADNANLDETELSLAAAMITDTPEAVVWDARVRKFMHRINGAAAFAAEDDKPTPERVRRAEERFWSEGPDERKLAQLFRDLDGIDPEEA